MKELEEMRKAFDNLTNSALQLNEMYKKKCKIIEKAIDCINQVFMLDEETGEYYLIHTFDKDGVKELLEILKGEENATKIQE